VETAEDRVHAAMLLQAGGRANALRALLAAEQDRGPDFLRLCNALTKPYDPDSNTPATQIYVEGANGTPVEISQKAKSLKQLRETYELTRYYVPESIRDRIDKIARETLRKEKD
jgi:hypothetical protein